MAFSLGPVARASGYRLVTRETIDSTSAEATRLALEGDPGRLWVVTAEQTSGHGRRGRPWHTPSGNLAASLLLPVPGDGARSATLGFAAGLALNCAIRTLVPELALPDAAEKGSGAHERLQLKWPNDVLLDDAKLAGILLEAVSLPSGSLGVVVGIGANVCHAPDGVVYPVTSLADIGSDITSEALFEALAEAWVEQEVVWDAGCGFANIRERWLAHAAGLGKPVAVRLGSSEFRGTFETIDEEGRLIVREKDGSSRSVSAGDVYFGGGGSVRL